MTLSDYKKISGLTNRELADQFGVSEMAVSYWLRARRMPSPPMMRLIEKKTRGKVRPADFYEGW